MTISGKSVLVICCATILCATSCQRSAFAETLDTSEIETLIQKGIDTFDIPGMSIAIVKNDTTVFVKGFGVRTVGDSTPVDEDTLFAIGSLTKAFTSTALGILVADGLVRFDDPISHHLPGFRVADPYVSQQMTIRDALSHRSGLKRLDNIWYLFPDHTRKVVLEKMPGLEQELGFRSAYLYNNLAYLAAGEIIPATTGKSWDEFLAQRIFRPLNMVDTNTSITSFRRDDNRATPHEKSEGELHTVPWRNLDNTAPAGATNSSAADMAQWCRLQNNMGRFNDLEIVPESIQSEIQSPQILLPVNPHNPTGHGTVHNSYTLGWGRQDYRGVATVLSHTGSIDGMFSMMSMLPDHGLCIVMLANSSDANVAQIVTINTIYDRYLGLEARDWQSAALGYKDYKARLALESERELDTSRIEGTSPTRELSAYVGKYSHPLLGELSVSLEDGLLALDRGPLFHGKMKHRHYDTFRIRWDKVGAEDGGIGNFTLDIDGTPSALTINPSDNSAPSSYQRVEPEKP